jgi:hypothetical protein
MLPETNDGELLPPQAQFTAPKVCVKFVSETADSAGFAEFFRLLTNA